MAPDSHNDTIAAIATASGAGGVGIVRASGPDAIAIVRAVIGDRELPERRMVHAIARDADGRIDEVLAVAMPGPKSFTGEDVAELHGHGGTFNLGRLLRAVVARGARIAEPGEFTRRAFEQRSSP
jgi:tRNA modification GTPase